MNLIYKSIFLSFFPFLSNAEDDKDPRIVGGIEAEFGRYPYQVGLVSSTGSPGCGGSLIAPDTVLSAAHCSGYFSSVIIGRYDFSDLSETYENIPIASETKHPDYWEYNLQNDLMIIKLSTASSYSPVKLDEKSQTLSSGTDVVVMGWGTTTSGGFQSNVLREVEVDIVSNQECNVQYGGGITNDMLCAARAGKDSCQGDSGGPLIIKGSNEANDVLVGVVSWGYGCADPSYAGVYSRVSENIEWIQNEMSRKATPEATLISKFKSMFN